MLQGLLKRGAEGCETPARKRIRTVKFESKLPTDSKELVALPYYNNSGSINQQSKMVSLGSYQKQMAEKNHLENENKKLTAELFSAKLFYEGRNPHPELREMRKQYSNLFNRYEANLRVTHQLGRKHSIESSKLKDKDARLEYEIARLKDEDARLKDENVRLKDENARLKCEIECLVMPI